VKSASSTIEAAQARQLRDHLAARVPGAITSQPSRAAQPVRLPRQGPPIDSYLSNFIDPDDRRRWLAAGLGPTDGGLAAECARAGLVPEDLARSFAGQTVVSRLRGGEPIGSVVARLREES
jgi:hypothetical protein